MVGESEKDEWQVLGCAVDVAMSASSACGSAAPATNPGFHIGRIPIGQFRGEREGGRGPLRICSEPLNGRCQGRVTLDGSRGLFFRVSCQGG